MDQNGRPAVQVVINGHDQMPYGSNMQFRNQRPLSVDEALQYSSMSSAPVFGLGSFIVFHLQFCSIY
jgi:cohesin loading factor subunit SCC2